MAKLAHLCILLIVLGKLDFSTLAREASCCTFSVVVLQRKGHCFSLEVDKIVTLLLLGMEACGGWTRCVQSSRWFVLHSDDSAVHLHGFTRHYESVGFHSRQRCKNLSEACQLLLQMSAFIGFNTFQHS